jgi:hypothetical protein
MRLAGPTASQVFSPKITQRQTTSHNSRNGRFCYRTMRPPLASFGHISAKNQATKPTLEPNWASGPDAKCCCMPLPISPVQHSTGLPSTHLCFFPIMPSSSRKLMMMAWKYYSTIIQIWVADAGEAGEELVGWGGTLAERNGCNQTVQADKEIMENLGGTQQSSIALMSLPAVFLFSPSSNYHIFKYI